MRRKILEGCFHGGVILRDFATQQDENGCASCQAGRQKCRNMRHLFYIFLGWLNIEHMTFFCNNYTTYPVHYIIIFTISPDIFSPLIYYHNLHFRHLPTKNRQKSPYVTPSPSNH